MELTTAVLPPDRSRRERAIVLVHGAWVGEWSWAPLIPLLESTGRSVHAVSLKGHGARRHESSPEVTLDDHVADLVSYVDTYDLTEIILVGHSYGGRVVTAAYEQLADRVDRMVYVDAHAPTAPDTGQSPERIAAAEAAGGFLAFTGYDPSADDVGGSVGLAWFLERTMPQSFKTFLVPMRATLPPELSKAFILCTGYEPSRFSHYAEAARASPDWEYHELDTDHWPMFNRAAELARIIEG